MNAWTRIGSPNLRHRRLAITALFACASATAGATDFPVTGTITINGNAGTLPTGGTFAGSAYDVTTGDIASGAFTFPVATLSFDTTFGPATATYQFSQTGTSTGQVANDGVAALTNASMKLQVLSATVNSVPLGIGTCVFQPIVLSLAGTGSAAGLDLADPAFTIPPAPAGDCGSFASQINDAVAGSNNSTQLLLAGNFTPPPDDVIFVDGFDLSGSP
jgi:hypothetical protein